MVALGFREDLDGHLVLPAVSDIQNTTGATIGLAFFGRSVSGWRASSTEKPAQ